MSMYGPDRKELRFRLNFSLAGLAMTVGALVYRGLPSGPAGVEAIVAGAIFFGGSTIWCIHKLRTFQGDD